MTLDPSVFKAYDVRGIVPDELDADGVYRTVRAYVDEFEPRSMAIGRDMRLTSPELCESAVQAALDAGSDVDEIGLVGTEMLYYAVCEHGYDGGLIVTASHNPKQYNGMKIVRRERAAPGGRRRHREGARPRAGRRVPHARGEGEARAARRPAGIRRTLPRHRRRHGHRAAACRSGRRQRDGRHDDGADPRPPAGRGRALPFRARRDISALPAEPAARGEPPVHHRRGQAHRRRSRHRLGRRRRSLLLHRRHRRSSRQATSSPR